MNTITAHRVNDNNIFHIFLLDIIRHYHPSLKNISIWTNFGKLDKDNSHQKWRFFVWKLLCENVNYIDVLPPNFNDYTISPIYDHMTKIKYPINKNYCYLYDKLSKNLSGKYILFNQRYNDNRTLYDDKTNNLLEDSLKNIGLPFKVCDFGNMTPEEQYDICSEAKVFICMHGAGCTNLMFTPKNTPLIEVGFETHWYCDPVCEEHFTGKISVNEKCNGKLHMRNFYHKNDYHNLCYLLGKPYYDIKPTRYGGGFISKNPITKRKVYVDSDEIIELARKLFLS